MHPTSGSEYSRQQSSLDRLVSLVFEGQATDNDLVELEQLTLGNQRLLTRYLRHVQIAAICERGGLFGASEPTSIKPNPSVTTRLQRLFYRSPVTGEHETRGELVLGTLVVAAVVVAFIGLATAIIYPRLNFLGNPSTPVAQPAIDAIDQPASPVVAGKIVGALAVEWAPGLTAKFVGSSLLAGEQVALVRGLLQVELQQGAVVSLRGPVKFQLIDQNGSKLSLGRLVATVPPRAVGFRVETPTSQIIDLGTEFGVEVTEAGTTEVNVLRGLVETTQIATHAGGQRKPIDGSTVQISAGQAARVEANSTTRLPANPAKFADIQLPPPAAAPQVSPEQFAGLRLWLRADRGVTADDQNRVTRWDDQSGHSFSAEQADVDCRPLLVAADSAVLPPLIRFDGVNDFLACNRGLDFDAAGDLTIAVVVQRFHTFKPHVGLFSLCSRAANDWNSLDGLALRQNSVAGQSTIGAVQGSNKDWLTSPFNELRMNAPIAKQGPYIITLTKAGGVATLRINGNTIGVDEFQFKPQLGKQPTTCQAGYQLGAHAENSKTSVGSEPFAHCDIAEVLVFDRALSGREGALVDQHLIHRYFNSATPLPISVPPKPFDATR